MIRIQALIDDSKCYEVVRNTRWPDGVRCPNCGGSEIGKGGKDDTQPQRQRYACQICHKQFDDLTHTVFAGHHQPLQVWVLCLYFMGLNLSNGQIAGELDLNDHDVQAMTSILRDGMVTRAPEPKLEGVVEADQVYILAGHKGHPQEVKKKGGRGRRRRLKGKRGRGTLEAQKPPILGLLERGGQVIIRMLANVQQKTIQPLFQQFVTPGSQVNTEEYVIYNRLQDWGYGQVSVNHAAGEFARDDDGDGVFEVHVNTLEGFWSLLRSWLRPHRGVSQEKLPLYLGFFQAVHNFRRRGKALLSSLLDVLLAPSP